MVPIVPKGNTQKVTFQEDLVHLESLREVVGKVEKANILDLIDRNPYPHLSLKEPAPKPKKSKEEEECDWFAESSSEEELEGPRPSPPLKK